MIKKETLLALEFDKVLAAAAAHTHSPASMAALLDVRPLPEVDAVMARLSMVSEIRRMADVGRPLPVSAFEDITAIIERLRPEGSAVDPPELLHISNALKIIRGAANRIREEGASAAPLLSALAGGLTGHPEIAARIEISIDPEGKISDAASPRLAALRADIRRLLTRINKKLEELIENKRTAIFLQDDFITRRSGRWVVPVRMDSKGMVPGVAHDVSRSGETAFIEPIEIIAPTNELENLEADARAEEIRVLRELGRLVRGAADGIMAEFGVLVQLDVLSAIAQLAGRLGMSVPLINEDSRIKLAGARHPLLLLMKNVPPVVPLDLELGETISIDGELGGVEKAMVITGPNAGGKTIAIKTVGLLILMALSGMPVPADSSSSLPFLNELIVDIGDDQSIERGMSTFSAHVARLAGILKEADDRTVILVDELGTGTDPAEGAALACAILKDLKAKGALVLATTHLTDIVGFVQQTPGLVNASMQFDPRTLTPLYKLKKGEPGQSRALETARRLGMPEGIVAEAMRLLGGARAGLEALIGEMKEKSLLYEERLAELKKEKAALAGQKRLFEETRAKEDEAGRMAVKKVFEEARLAVQEAKRNIYAIMEEEKRERKSREAASREALKKLSLEQQKIDHSIGALCPAPDASAGQALTGEIRQGDTVFINSLQSRGTVMSVDEKLGHMRVKTGGLHVLVPAGDAVLVARAAANEKEKEKTQKGEVTLEYASGPAPSAGSINLIGLRVEEALSRLEPFLNHASIAGLGEVTIIHGMGTGRLMKAVREYLKGHPLVENFRRADQPAAAADGATIAALR